jgi:hypothetical protein
MPQSQTWPLSQGANKASGTCSICHATRQLHLKDGTVHVHGSCNNPCPGSRQPPLAQTNSAPFTTHSTPSSQATTTSAPTSSTSTSHSTTPVVSQSHTLCPTFTHPHCDVPIIKHIPKSARSACCTTLSATLRAITQSPEDLAAWSRLMNFGRSILHKSTRGGQRHNLASTIKKRTADVSALVSVPQGATAVSRKSQSPSAALAATVSAKIEDGNIRAAVRIICSEDKPAPDTEATFKKLQEKHPPSSSRSKPFPDPSLTPALQVSEADVLKAIRSFPAGSSGGPDGLRPQHVVDLVGCQESGAALLSAITAFTNMLLEGKCHRDVAPVLFGGSLIALEKKTGGIRPIAIGYT